MPTHEDHISSDSKWQIYESNVQSYRGLALSTQSIYLAVGAILTISTPWWIILILALSAVFTTWFVWFQVIFCRTAIVDFHKFNLGDRLNADGSLREPGQDGPALNEREYSSFYAVQLRRTVYSSLNSIHIFSEGTKFRTLRQSRMKIDVVIPIFMSATWLIFVVSPFFAP